MTLRRSVLLAVAILAGPSSAAFAVPLQPHKAVYDLSLQSASERSGITRMDGRMVYEFTGNECDGYRVNFRFVTTVDSGGEKKLTDQQTTTFEDVRNRTFDFENKTFSGENLDRQVNGSASHGDEGLTVELFSPDERQVQLTRGRFPTEHMMEVIRKAVEGGGFFESPLFDGTDSADKLMQTTTIIGKQAVVEGPDADKAGTLAKVATWPVTIAYFNDTTGADAQPVYRISFRLYENGITRDLTMDYGDFVLSGHLASLDMIKPTPCGE